MICESLDPMQWLFLEYADGVTPYVGSHPRIAQHISIDSLKSLPTIRKHNINTWSLEVIEQIDFVRKLSHSTHIPELEGIPLKSILLDGYLFVYIASLINRLMSCNEPQILSSILGVCMGSQNFRLVISDLLPDSPQTDIARYYASIVLRECELAKYYHQKAKHNINMIQAQDSIHGVIMSNVATLLELRSGTSVDDVLALNFDILSRVRHIGDKALEALITLNRSRLYRFAGDIGKSKSLLESSYHCLPNDIPFKLRMYYVLQASILHECLPRLQFLFDNWQSNVQLEGFGWRLTSLLDPTLNGRVSLKYIHTELALLFSEDLEPVQFLQELSVLS